MATKTIGSAGGRDYATLAAWASYVNALTLSAPEIGQCFNDSEFVISASVSLTGWSGGSSTNTVTLTTGSGQSFIDNASVQTNALQYNQSNGVGIRTTGIYFNMISVGTGNFILSKLQLKGTGLGMSCFQVTACANVQVLQNVMEGGSFRTISYAGTNTTQLIENCVISNNAGGKGIGGVGYGGNIYECTIIRPTNNAAGSTGVNLTYSTYNFTDCFLFNWSTPIVSSGSGAAPTISYCGTDAASLSGSNNKTSLTINSEIQQGNATTGLDCRAKSGGTGIDAGTTVGAAYDIVGTTRPQGSAYDIGCWELVVASAANHNMLPLAGCG